MDPRKKLLQAVANAARGGTRGGGRMPPGHPSTSIQADTPMGPEAQGLAMGAMQRGAMPPSDPPSPAPLPPDLQQIQTSGSDAANWEDPSLSTGPPRIPPQIIAPPSGVIMENPGQGVEPADPNYQEKVFSGYPPDIPLEKKRRPKPSEHNFMNDIVSGLEKAFGRIKDGVGQLTNPDSYYNAFDDFPGLHGNKVPYKNLSEIKDYLAKTIKKSFDGNIREWKESNEALRSKKKYK